MFKEVDNISTLGLIEKGITGRQMFENIWNIYYENNLDNNIKNHILTNCIYDDNYKIVDDNLKPFIGVYPIDCNGISIDWKQKFITLLDCWLYEIYCNWPSAKIKTDKGSLYNMKQKLYSLLQYASDFDNGYIFESNRKNKILKYIKNKIKQHTNLTDVEIEEREWYKFYMMKKESGNKLYLVITNSIASQLGMSSYAPKINNISRLWQSCQSIDDYYNGYARRVPPNLTDAGSLICYITDGTNVDFKHTNHNLNNDYIHNAMICRWMVRMLKDKHNTLYLAIDRAYPNDAYIKPVIKVLIDLCKENNIQFAIHENYNSSQNDDINYDIINNIRNCNKSIYASSLHPIMYSSAYTEYANDKDYLTHYDDQEGNVDSGYGGDSNEYICFYMLNPIEESIDLNVTEQKFKLGDAVRIITARHGITFIHETGIICAQSNDAYGIKTKIETSDNLYGVIDTNTGVWVNAGDIELFTQTKESEAA